MYTCIIIIMCRCIKLASEVHSVNHLQNLENDSQIALGNQMHHIINYTHITERYTQIKGY